MKNRYRSNFGHKKFELKKTERIKEALYSVANLYPREDTVFLPILDILLLLYQKPAVITFFNNIGRLYTTMQDAEFKVNYEQWFDSKFSELSKLGLGVTILPNQPYKIIIDGILGIDKYYWLGTDKHENLKYLFEDLRKTDWGLDILEDMIVFITSEKKSPSLMQKAEKSLSEIVMTEEEEEELFKPIRQALDECYKDFWRAEIFKTKKVQDLEIPNLFCVIRSASDSNRRNYFNYTARVLLSEMQKKNITRWFEKQGEEYPAELTKHLEYPLGPNSRSIADSTFASGLIDFSYEKAGRGRDISGSAVEDQSRIKAEQKLYTHISDRTNVFYIPIHFEGLPWLSLFTFDTNVKENEKWMKNFSIYRDIIPKLSTELRVRLKEAYLKILKASVSKVFKETRTKEIVTAINHEFKLISYIYPYKPIKLIETDRENYIKFPDGTKIDIELNTYNPYFDILLDFKITSEKKIIKMVRDILNENIAIINKGEVTRQQIEILRQEKDIADTIKGLGHFLKNRIAPVITDLNAVCNDIKTYKEENKIDEFNKILTTLDRIQYGTESAENTGEMLDILAKSGNAFKNKPKVKWISDKHLALGQLLHVLNEKTFSKEVRPTLNIIEKVKEKIYTIRNYMAGRVMGEVTAYRSFRPADFFYEEIFFELLWNAKKKGVNNKEGKAEVRITLNGETGVCIVENLINQDGQFNRAEYEEKFGPCNHYTDQQETFTSGLGYISKFLKVTEIGSLKVGWFERDQELYFSIQLYLKGVKRLR